MNLNVRIAAAAYAVPPDEETVAEILERERLRVETTLAPLSSLARQRVLDNLGLSRVRVCGEEQPYDLALKAVKAAIDEAVPAPVLSAALYARFGSRGDADFANRVQSAMRHEFGGHVEKPGDGPPTRT